jgi:hypothetical protein
LSADDIKVINELDRNPERSGPDPAPMGF